MSKNPLNGSDKFPLYKNDGIASESLTASQQQAINALKEKIRSGQYVLVENKCMCNNDHPEQDILIAEKDRYGIPVENILCSKCGLIRSGKVFDEKSIMEFYKNDYRHIYVRDQQVRDSFFNAENRRGQVFLKLFNQYVEQQKNISVFEIGCGSGGILYPFHQASHQCKGCDYNESYLDFGRSKGLDLRYGDYQTIVEDNSVDLLILSHVMEHFLNPIDEIIAITKKVKLSGYLLIEVPGIFCIHKMYFNPILYFQNAHIYNYYYDYLKIFFKTLGLNVICGNERSTFILQKPADWKETKVDEVFNQSLAKYPKVVKDYIYFHSYFHSYHINPYQAKDTILKIMKMVGLK